MFAVIETKGATHIVINIPVEGADKSLPALARMLENNAVFVNKGYGNSNIVKPEMAITLCKEYEITTNEEKLIVICGESDCVVDESFSNATPAVLTSNREQLQKRDAEIRKLQTELSFVKQEKEQLLQKISTLVESTEENTQ